MTLTERFRAKFVAGEPDACWLWHGARMSHGYGHIRVGRRDEGTIGAHVLAATLDGRPPGPGEEVHHTCRTRACVNPAHLEVLKREVHAEEHVGRPSPQKGAFADTCRRGHPRSESVTRGPGGPVVYCKACRRETRALRKEQGYAAQCR